jgi:hypothetical protein
VLADDLVANIVRVHGHEGRIEPAGERIPARVM